MGLPYVVLGSKGAPPLSGRKEMGDGLVNHPKWAVFVGGF